MKLAWNLWTYWLEKRQEKEKIGLEVQNYIKLFAVKADSKSLYRRITY